MNHPTMFRINTPKITHQTIDGETIIIDFESGAYYSTDGAGAVIWELIAHMASVDEINQTLARHYAQTDPTAIKSHLEQFIAELERESLIVPVDPANTRTEKSATAQPPAGYGGGVFEAPTIFKYTDMQDLLLLDPIHDVDEQGWPMKKEEGGE